mgnify:CR=1 FL=1
MIFSEINIQFQNQFRIMEGQLNREGGDFLGSEEQSGIFGGDGERGEREFPQYPIMRSKARFGST